jgi:hypothetical protein
VCVLVTADVTKTALAPATSATAHRTAPCSVLGVRTTSVAPEEPATSPVRATALTTASLGTGTGLRAPCAAMGGTERRAFSNVRLRTAISATTKELARTPPLRALATRTPPVDSGQGVHARGAPLATMALSVPECVLVVRVCHVSTMDNAHKASLEAVHVLAIKTPPMVTGCCRPAQTASTATGVLDASQHVPPMPLARFVAFTAPVTTECSVRAPAFATKTAPTASGKDRSAQHAQLGTLASNAAACVLGDSLIALPATAMALAHRVPQAAGCVRAHPGTLVLTAHLFALQG